ncbi:MAG TPA: hypothetical protein VFR37_01695, partial [Longimicrobium sp.]|nr:hypothetical protein [Longimicrobium sp.]
YVLFFIAFLYGLAFVYGEFHANGPMLAAMFTAGVGTLLLWSARRDEAQATQMTATERQRAVLQLAEAEDGQLTVTEVAARLGWSLDEAAATLRSMDDGLRVTTTLTDEGIILYDFPELIHDPGRRKRLR